MGTKDTPGQFDCYANALPDEPMFVLLARDPSAPDLVEAWAAGRIYAIAIGKKPQSDMAMVEEAQDCAKAMRVWAAQKNGSWPAGIEEMTDRERAIKALRRGVPLGEVVQCSCFTKPPTRNGCFGVCEDSVAAIVASYADVRERERAACEAAARSLCMP